jgi:hypothetical protein
MTYARSRATAVNDVRRILTTNGLVLFDEVVIFSTPRTRINGGTERGYFVVAATDQMPVLFGKTVTVSSADGSTTCAVITHVAGHIVQFRTAGATRP